ncbi:hypothetical protein LSM04_003119 [Trypanosoma melophagium]|uniref:uncharacterized protein n=1 Tax=Trypanosoma melophagium TaxID=715481 RepID=UPI00351A4397|nr:hypothetical protein LSM04_003119 [Trypanosoma melophagium]
MSRVLHRDYQKRGKQNHVHDRGVTSVLRASDPAFQLMDSTGNSLRQNEPMRASMDSFVSLYRSYATVPTSTSIKGGLEDVRNVWAPSLNKKSAPSRESDNNNNNNNNNDGMISPKVAPIRALRVKAPEEECEFTPVVKRERVPHRPVRGNAPPFLCPPVSNESSRSRGPTPPQANQQSRGSSTNNINNGTLTGIVPVKNQNGFQNSFVPLINPSITKNKQQKVLRDVMYVPDSPTLNKKNGTVLPVEKGSTPSIDGCSNRVDVHSNPNTSKVSATTTVLHAPQNASDMKREGQDTLSAKGSISSQNTSLSGVLPLPSNAAHISTTTVTRTVRKVKYIPVEEEYIESAEDEEEPIDNVVPPSTSESYTKVSGTAWKPSNWQSTRAPENSGDCQLSPYKSAEQGTPVHLSTPQFPRTNSGLSTVSILSSNKWARRCYMMSPIRDSPELYPAQAPIIMSRGESVPNGATFLLQRHHQAVEVGRRMWGRYFSNNSSNTDSNSTEPRPLLTFPATNAGVTLTGNTSSSSANGALNGTVNHESGSKSRNNRLPPSGESVESPRSTLPNFTRLQDITAYRQLSSSTRSAASCATVTQTITVDDRNGSPDDVGLAKKPENKQPRRVIIADSDWDEEEEYDEYDDEEYEEDDDEEGYEEDVYTGEVDDLGMPASPTLTVAARNVANQDSLPSEREELDSGSLDTN